MAWCAGFGRLGGIFGPLIGGALISAGISSQVAFYVFAGIAVLGGIVTFFVPRARVTRAEVAGTGEAAYSTVQVS